MIKNNEYEINRINSRTKFLFYFIIFFILIISIRVMFLQFFKNEFYSEKAINNVIKEIEISPVRGNIFDRNNNLIAGNRALYELVIVPEKIYGYKKDKSNSIDKLFEDINNIIDISDIDKDKLKKKILNTASFREVVLLSDLSEKQLSEITANLKYIDGVSLTAKYVRDYPYKDLYLPLLGYVGRVSKEDLNKYEDIDIIANDFIGKLGLEKSFNKRLYGKPGKDTVMINASGRIIDRHRSIKPTNGEDIYLTIDHDLQKLAYEELKALNKKGAVVAMDLEKGDILAFFSNPTYDANKFIRGISHSEYEKYFKKDSPIFNRVIQGQYAPASTIKPFVSVAALSGDFITADEICNCGGFYQIGKQKFRDWKRSGHGKIDMIQAIARSSDVYYYKLAHQMGIDYLHDFLSYFGFGKKLDIPLINQKSGLLPSDEWKRKAKGEPFYAGDTVIVGIGQGSFLATPLQMMNSASILALNGEEIKPLFELKEEKEVVNKTNFKQEFIDVAKTGMYETMHGKRGTGREHAKKLDFKVAGKTGTAQVFSTQGKIDYDNLEMPEHLRDHGLFIGYAPYDNPKIVVAVVVEHGKSGALTATPIGINLMKKYMEKKYLLGGVENE